jgi:hypothetical protein
MNRTSSGVSYGDDVAHSIQAMHGVRAKIEHCLRRRKILELRDPDESLSTTMRQQSSQLRSSIGHVDGLGDYTDSVSGKKCNHKFERIG